MTAACKALPRRKVIPFEPYRRRARQRLWRQRLYVLLAIVPQYLSLGSLVLYAALRLLFTANIPFSYYMGPLTLLWPISFFLLLISYVSDLLLWEE